MYIGTVGSKLRNERHHRRSSSGTRMQNVFCLPRRCQAFGAFSMYHVCKVINTPFKQCSSDVASHTACRCSGGIAATQDTVREWRLGACTSRRPCTCLVHVHRVVTADSMLSPKHGRNFNSCWEAYTIPMCPHMIYVHCSRCSNA